MRIWDKVLRRLPKVKTTQKTTSLRKSWGGALEAKNSKSPTEPRWGYCFQCDAGQYACSPYLIISTFLGRTPWGLVRLAPITLTVCGVWLRESRHLKARTWGSLISRRRPVGSHGLRRTPRELSDTSNFHGCKEHAANSQTYLTVSDTYPTLGVSTKRCFETPVRYNRHHPRLSDTPLRRFQGGMDKNTPQSHRHVPNS